MGELKSIDYIILGIIVAVMALCIWNLIRDRKRGVPSCGAKSCAGCGLAAACTNARKAAKN